jgi:nucleoside phosphorylase
LWNYWQKRGENDPEVTHALLRNLGTLLPSPDQASVQKEEVMRIATALLKCGTEEDILALRSVIGDVVAADKVYGYEAGKAANTFKTRPEATTVSLAAFHRANAVKMDKIWQNRINPVPSHRPKALVKPIAAGEKIVASKRSEEFKRLKETYSDAHAVAMEEHGFCVSVKAHPKVCFAVVRGISDLIEKKEESDASGSHEIAARNAAAFAFEMLAGFMRARLN